jgi:hypothetical protein
MGLNRKISLLFTLLLCRVKQVLFFGTTFRNGKSISRSSNDDRSDSMNPNNDAYDDSMDNHSNQLNPNNDAYQGSDDSDDDDD